MTNFQQTFNELSFFLSVSVYLMGLPRLPDEVWTEIFSYLQEAVVVKVCSRVCQSWRESVRRTRLSMVAVGDAHTLTFTGMKKVSTRWPLILGIEYRSVQPLNDISGVVWCRQLRELDLSSSGIEDLRPLFSCRNLVTLNLAHTKVCDISCLSNVPHLRLLSVRSCPLKDISSLSSCTLLASLDLQYTHVADISSLSFCHELRKLDLRGTPVEDITPLRTCQKLQTVDLSLTYVEDISPLKGSQLYLSSLNLYRTPVTNIEALVGCPQLQKVFMQSCEFLRSVAPLAHCPQLSKVDLKNTTVTDHEFLIRMGLDFLRLPMGDIIVDHNTPWSQVVIAEY
jgi:Leucine-rich repeat (LRR) protein